MPFLINSSVPLAFVFLAFLHAGIVQAQTLSPGIQRHKTSVTGNREDDRDTSSSYNHFSPRTIKNEEERQRVALLKQIKSLDHMKCFPKVLCGLSVDSAKASQEIDSYFVRSYVQLMRSIDPDDDSNEEAKPDSDPTKDAISLFLMKSGLLSPRKESHSASSSEEDDGEAVAAGDSAELSSKRGKSQLQLRNEALESLLAKRRLTDDGSGNLNNNDAAAEKWKLPPILYFPSPTPSLPKTEPTGQSLTGQLGSLVSSWVPWISLSFGGDSSLENDPFFKRKTSSKIKEKDKERLEDLILLMKLKEAALQGTNKDAGNVGREGRGLKDQGPSSITTDEVKVYATAVEIGKKLKDAKQCDYLYNGCPVSYSDIIRIISSIRHNMKPKDESGEQLSQEQASVPSQKNKRPGSAPTKKQRPTSAKKKPMTQISHTLPNGEKVEINVQLSAKPEEGGELEFESPHGEDEYVGQEEESETDGLVDNKTSSSTTKEPEEYGEEGPAISASYELENEKLEGTQDHKDYRKPLPADIFKRVNTKKKVTTPRPQTTSSPKYKVKKKHQSITEMPTTGKPTRTAPTTAVPSSRRPAKTPMTTTVRPKKPTRRNTTTNPTINESARKTTPRPYKGSKGSSSRHKASTPIPIRVSEWENEGQTAPTSTKETNLPHSWITYPNYDAIKTSQKSSEKRKPQMNVSPQMTETYSKSPQSSSGKRHKNKNKVVIEIAGSHERDESEENASSVPKQAASARPRPTISPPLAAFTTSFMDQVIADLYKTRRTTTTTTVSPISLIFPGNSPQRPRPLKLHGSKKKPSSITHWSNRRNLTGLTNDRVESYITSVESGSSEGGRPSLITAGIREPDFGNDDGVDVEERPPNRQNVTNPSKKRIQYKNPKRPYLVLMTPPAEANNSAKPKRKRPSEYDGPESEFPEELENDPRKPLVIEPGVADYGHWTPTL